jgi:prepilin-type N-terminal cleavage/methylation domain-containing protein
MTFSSAIFNRRSTLVGFTLIELLVVVAIIALLATISVTGALAARNKAKDSRIQATLSQVRAQAELILNSDYVYNRLCDANHTLNDAEFPDSLGLIENDVKKYNGGIDPTCYTTADAYCVQSPLNVGGYHCIDSIGYAGKTANCTSGHIACQ